MARPRRCQWWMAREGRIRDREREGDDERKIEGGILWSFKKSSDGKKQS